MEKKRDYAISMVRCVAMCFIISCHILQYMGNELSLWFNVGVQIFFCLSGYLYGGKNNSGAAFVKRAFRKILVSYYIVIIPFALIALLKLHTITLSQFFRTLFVNMIIPGGEHLWFIPSILCCYLFTPLITDCYEEANTVGAWAKCTIILLALTFVIIKYFVYVFSYIWLSCYVVGFALKKLELIQKRQISLTAALPLFVLTVVTNGLQIISENYVQLPIPEYELFCNYAKAFLGISLFILLRKCFRNIGPCKLLRFSDKYSYEIYLVHQFFILGPLSLMGLTSRIYFNIAAIMVLIVALAVVVKHLSLRINTMLDRRLLEGGGNKFS